MVGLLADVVPVSRLATCLVVGECVVKSNWDGSSRLFCKFMMAFALALSSFMDLGGCEIQYTMIESKVGSFCSILRSMRTVVLSFSMPGHLALIMRMRRVSWALKNLSRDSNWAGNVFSASSSRDCWSNSECVDKCRCMVCIKRAGLIGMPGVMVLSAISDGKDAMIALVKAATERWRYGSGV